MLHPCPILSPTKVSPQCAAAISLFSEATYCCPRAAIPTTAPIAKQTLISGPTHFRATEIARLTDFTGETATVAVPAMPKAFKVLEKTSSPEGAEICINKTASSSVPVLGVGLVNSLHL